MTIFVVIVQPSSNEERLAGAIARIFPGAHLQLNEKAWLVATPGTIREVSDKLGVTDGTNGSAVITEVGSYYGRANPDIWNWVKTKWEATAHG